MLTTKAYWLYLKEGEEQDLVGHKANHRSNGNGPADRQVLCHPETLFHLLSCVSSSFWTPNQPLSWFLLSLCQSTVSFKYVSICLNTLLYMTYVSYVIHMIHISYMWHEKYNFYSLHLRKFFYCIFPHDRQFGQLQNST